MKKSIKVIAYERMINVKEVKKLFENVKADGVSAYDGKTKLYSDETINKVFGIGKD